MTTLEKLMSLADEYADERSISWSQEKVQAKRQALKSQLREALTQQESEIQRLKSLLRIADIKLAQIEAKDMQDNPDDYVMQY